MILQDPPSTPLKFNIEPKNCPSQKERMLPFATIFQGRAVSFTESKDLLGELQLLLFVLFLHRLFGDIAEIPKILRHPNEMDQSWWFQICMGSLCWTNDCRFSWPGCDHLNTFDHNICDIYIYRFYELPTLNILSTCFRFTIFYLPVFLLDFNALDVGLAFKAIQFRVLYVVQDSYICGFIFRNWYIYICIRRI